MHYEDGEIWFVFHQDNKIIRSRLQFGYYSTFTAPLKNRSYFVEIDFYEVLHIDVSETLVPFNNCFMADFCFELLVYDGVESMRPIDSAP